MWPPVKPLTPGTLHHHLVCDRLRVSLLQSSCRELIGVRGAGPPRHHRQRFGPEPLEGLLLSIRCPVLRRTGPPLAHPLTELPDNDLGHATLFLNAAAYLLAQVSPATNQLPLFLYAYQNWRAGWAPQQVWLIHRQPHFALTFFDYLQTAYRYDLLAQPITHTVRDSKPETAAQTVWAATRAAGVSLQPGTREATSLFDANSKESDGEINGSGQDA